jgi:hypothetical protein
MIFRKFRSYNPSYSDNAIYPRYSYGKIVNGPDDMASDGLSEIFQIIVNDIFILCIVHDADECFITNDNDDNNISIHIKSVKIIFVIEIDQSCLDINIVSYVQSENLLNGFTEQEIDECFDMCGKIPLHTYSYDTIKTIIGKLLCT